MLTKCKECGCELSDKAYVCPHCGAPTHPTAATSPARLATILCLVSIVGCLLAVVSSWPYGLSMRSFAVLCAAARRILPGFRHRWTGANGLGSWGSPLSSSTR
jgi:hypothetical protein